MNYSLTYQYMPSGNARPEDGGETIELNTSDDPCSFYLIPNIGDYVEIQNPADGDSFAGMVKSRLFNYFRTDGNNLCRINIVIEETGDDWGVLIKE